MQPIHIGRFKEGLEKDVAEYLLPDTAFPEMENAFIFRDKVMRREGCTLLARLQRDLTGRSIGSSSNGRNFSGNVISSLESTAELKPGSLTVHFGGYDFTSETNSEILTGVTIGSGTINWSSGQVNVDLGSALLPPGTVLTADFSYYPGLPVMALPSREISNAYNEQTIAFDTKYCYRFDTGTQSFVELSPGTTWQGTDTNFFDLTQYYVKDSVRLTWATNFNISATSDPIRYFDGTSWVNFFPAVDSSGGKLIQARILIPFKNRLIALNTWEGNATWTGSNFTGTFDNYFNRARWCWNGDPTDDIDGWRSDVVGLGGYFDCPTVEAIVSAELINDVIIVGFERSTWRLRYTGNEDLPFVWEIIDHDIGSDSTFSMVNAGNVIYSISDRAITTCNGSNPLERIDMKIPDDVFTVSNDNLGPERVHGIRDYTRQIIYWTFPSDQDGAKYPNKLLVLNYQSGSYSYFLDSYTCFGYHQRTTDLTWGEATMEWGSANFKWGDSRNQKGYPDIIAGNQQGFVMVMNDEIENDPTLSITNVAQSSGILVFTSRDHNLSYDDVIQITGMIGDLSSLNGVVGKIYPIDSDTFSIYTYESTGFTEPLVYSSPFVYYGGGLITRVSNFSIKTKQINPWYEQSQSVKLVYTDFYLDVTASGEFTLDIFVDSVIDEPNNTPDYLNPRSNVVLTSIEPGQRGSQIRSAHRYSRGCRGQFIQLGFRLSDEQLNDQLIANQDFVLNFMTLWVEPEGSFV